IKKELNLPIVEIADPKATLDGGDVLFTGREFFVGISKRTNEAGACAVAAAFPEFPVTPIPVPNKLLHLKACLSMAGPDIICVGLSPEAQTLIKNIEREATFRYTTLTVPDDAAANVLYINGTIVHRSEYPNSNDVFGERIDYPRKSCKLWEISKAQGLLSCMSILVKKPKSKRN
ncbi:N(G):N(G)-dimethylarginine dimethylaminohydrolase 1-like protein, partial [Leptotrombidium deliense]